LPALEKASKVKSFVKTESYPTYKHARLICSRNDHFKVEFGPFIKAVERVVYDRPEFIKHVPVPERPLRIATLRKAGRRYYLTDFTAFESHFTPAVMKACEIELLLRCSTMSDEWNRYMIRVLTGVNKVNCDMVSFKVKGKRMSGEMSTSLFNGIANLMLLKFIVMKKHGKVDAFVEGDDGIFSTSVPVLQADYEKLGFTAKIVEVLDPLNPIPVDGSEPGQMAFCGVVCTDSLHNLRDPRKFLQTFGWTSSFIDAGDKIMAKLLRAKALSACYETPHCPIVGVMAREALARTRGVRIDSKIRDAFDIYHTVPTDESAIPEFAPTDEDREAVFRNFGICASAQLLIEQSIERGSLEDLPSLVTPSFDSLHFSTRYVVVA
jgi:hypothetical protein